MAVIKSDRDTTKFTCIRPHVSTFAMVSIPKSIDSVRVPPAWETVPHLQLRVTESGGHNRVYLDIETAEALNEELQALIVELKAKEGGA